ncbi:MAG: twin-arginine translocase TatA/TatE family subunit [Deltaproteobacteria bacterium]|nr:twin-arginine translocase TatA/TatE family subunit [Deltaproteobacteria bacterium]
MENLNLAFFGGIGLSEILIIGGVAVLLFGAKKLPELGRGIAQGIKELKKGLGEDDGKKEDKKDSNTPQSS